MKILVTGGAGFIGRNFIYYMQEKHPDYDIGCLDALTYAGTLKNLDKAMEKENFMFYLPEHCVRLTGCCII